MTKNTSKGPAAKRTANKSTTTQSDVAILTAIAEIKRLRIDILQAEMYRLGLIKNEAYMARIVDKVNELDVELAILDSDLAEMTRAMMKKDGV